MTDDIKTAAELEIELASVKASLGQKLGRLAEELYQARAKNNRYRQLLKTIKNVVVDSPLFADLEECW
jgi:hypothetical protein